MFRMLKFIFTLTIGLYLGFQVSLMLMRSECSALGGTWTGSICKTTDASND